MWPRGAMVGGPTAGTAAPTDSPETTCCWP